MALDGIFDLLWSDVAHLQRLLPVMTIGATGTGSGVNLPELIINKHLEQGSDSNEDNKGPTYLKKFPSWYELSKPKKKKKKKNTNTQICEILSNWFEFQFSIHFHIRRNEMLKRQFTIFCTQIILLNTVWFGYKIKITQSHSPQILPQDTLGTVELCSQQVIKKISVAQ